MTKIGRNDPCPCGSGKKYKKCCSAKDEQAALAAYAASVVPPVTASAAESGEAAEGGEQTKARGTATPGGRPVPTARQERRFTPQVSAPPPIVRRKSV
jgi:hypothetical protein